MTLQNFFLIALSLFALVHYVFVPRARRRLSVDRSMAAIGHAASLSVVEFLRSAAAIATVTVGGMIVSVVLLRIGGTADVVHVGAAIARIARAREILLQFRTGWSAAVVLLLVLALSIYAHRAAKRSYKAIFQKLFEAEFERVRKEMEAGRLESLPSTAEMERAEQQIEKGREIFEKLSTDQSEGAEAARKQVADRVYQMMAYRQALDIARRVDVKLDPDAVQMPEPENWQDRVKTIFMSRGLVTGVSRATKAAYVCSMVLLIPSLTGLVAAPAAGMLTPRLVELSAIRMQLARNDWQQTKQQLGAPTRQLTKDEETLIDRAARAYEQRLASPAVLPQVHLPATAYNLRASIVSNQILDRARQRSTIKWSQYASGSHAENLTATERAVVEVPETALHSTAPVTAEGQRIRSELADAARRSPRIIDRLRAGAHAFAEPATADDISHALLSHLVGDVAGETPGPWGDLFSGFDFAETRPAAAWYQEATRHQFLSDLAAGRDAAEALNGVGRAATQRKWVTAADLSQMQAAMRTATERLPLDQIDTKLRERPPGVEIAEEKDVKWTAVSEDLTNIQSDEMLSRRLARNPEQLTECVATYRDWFPNHPGASETTKRGKLLAVFDHPNGPETPLGTGGGQPTVPSGGGGGSEGAAALETRAARAVEASAAEEGAIIRGLETAAQVGGEVATEVVRARSFVGLSGFARVGGVLIGRPPNDDGQFGFSDLQWQIEGKTVRLILTRRDGKKYRSHPYRAAIAYQALTYASDGRPLAATMTTAAPLLDLKIHLHPTLVDTPLGFRVVEIDRFVDAYARADKKDPVAARIAASEAKMQADVALYSFAWAERILSLQLPAMLESADSDEKHQKAVRFMLAVHRYATEMAQDDGLRKSASEAWSRRQELFAGGNENASIIRAKSAYFDATLVTLLQRYANDEAIRTFDDLEQRMSSRSSANDEQKLTESWLTLPPKFEVWSGVREAEYGHAVPSVLMLDGQPTPAPFNFILQIAFTSEPAFAGDKNYVDVPWTFPDVARDVHLKVVSSVSKDPRAKEIMTDVAEFTMLQRLFRMALRGQLGEIFPVEKLGALADALAPLASKYAPTPRWNARPQMLEHMRARATGGDAEAITKLIKLRKDLGVDKEDAVVLRGDRALPPID